MTLNDIREPRTKREYQQLAAAYSHYLYNPIKTLKEAYKAPSKAKVAAYNSCLEIQQELVGIDGSIIYAGCQLFTFGFTVRRSVGPYEEYWFVYITKATNYKYLIYKRRYR